MIAQDKLFHFLVGAVIGFAVTLLLGWVLACVVVIIAAIGKEVYDKYHPNHTVDIYDAVATLLGGGFVILVYLTAYTLG